MDFTSVFNAPPLGPMNKKALSVSSIMMSEDGFLTSTKRKPRHPFKLAGTGLGLTML
jgi:hypothetical protein